MTSATVDAPCSSRSHGRGFTKYENRDVQRLDSLSVDDAQACVFRRSPAIVPLFPVLTFGSTANLSLKHRQILTGHLFTILEEQHRIHGPPTNAVDQRVMDWI